MYGELTKPCRIYVNFVASDRELQHTFVGSFDTFT